MFTNTSAKEVSKTKLMIGESREGSIKNKMFNSIYVWRYHLTKMKR